MAGRDSTFDMLIKILMIGDSGVGKTSLLVRYANDSFSPHLLNTIGVDFKIKNIKLDDKKVKLQIWDTGGQERFRVITKSYYRGAQGILLAYDVTDRRSFVSIRNWVAQIKELADENVDTILIGNKCDCPDDRVISYDEGEKLAKEYNVKFYETSAKEDVNVERAFITIATDAKNRLIADDWGNNNALNTCNVMAGRSSIARKGCCY